MLWYCTVHPVYPFHGQQGGQLVLLIVVREGAEVLENGLIEEERGKKRCIIYVY